MSLEYKVNNGNETKVETIETIVPKNIPEGSVEKIMNFFNQPGYKSITEEEAIWLIKEVREGMKISQEKTEKGIIETQNNIAA